MSAAIDGRSDVKETIMTSILIVEDNKLLREMLKDIFESNGFKVRVALDGQDGIDSYRKEPAGLVITDVIMPGKDGLAMIRDLKKEFPDVKIIVISGADADVPDRLQVARELGAIRALRKPFAPDALLDAVNEVLAGSPF